MIYEQGSKQGNRILHVLDHMVPNPTKLTHTLFSDDQEELWSLWNDGWVLSSDDGGRGLIPVWPHQKYAALCAEDLWEGSVPKLIELEAWMERWIGGAKRDARLIAVFPTREGRGAEVEPERLAADLELELTNYE